MIGCPVHDMPRGVPCWTHERRGTTDPRSWTGCCASRASAAYADRNRAERHERWLRRTGRKRASDPPHSADITIS